MTTKNLGLIKAIYVQTTAPTNTKVIWLDTSLTTPLHKSYNPTSASWEAFIYLTLIDNDTVKRDGDGKLYVDPSALSTYVINDGSILLAKLANVATGTVFYRKTTGTGVPEVQTLATLKADLGLTGTNSGDKNLSIYALKATTVNLKALSGDIVLTPEDIGSPSGSGTSTGDNSGDETEASILSKLGLVSISGENNGDQDAIDVPIEDTAEQFNADNVEGALVEAKTLIDEHTVTLSSLSSIPTVTLSAGSNVSDKITGATVPDGWTLAVGSTSADILITHNKDARVAFVSVFYVEGTEEVMLIGTPAYNGIRTPDTNSLIINSIATGITSKIVKIYISFV